MVPSRTGTPRSRNGILEIHRVLKVGGINGFTSWTQPGWRPALLRVAPPLADHPILQLFQNVWVHEAQITADLTRLGFKDVEFTPYEYTKDIKDPEEYRASLEMSLPVLFSREIAEKTIKCLMDDFGGKEVYKSVIVTAVKA